MTPLSPSQRLQAFRQLLKEHEIDAYIVPTADSHNSEYPCEHFCRRAYITGFTGSAGTAVITATEALLWTDGRYFLQAEQELDGECWKLMKDGLPECPSISKWIQQNCDKLKTVSADTFTYSVSAWRELTSSNKPNAALFKTTAGNLVDAVWRQETDPAAQQPPLPDNPVHPHPLKYAGKSVHDKLQEIRSTMVGNNSTDVLVLSDLTDIAWLTNLRGSDFDMVPVFLSYFVITAEEARLYVKNSKLSNQADQQLRENQIQIRAYDAITSDLTEFSSRRNHAGFPLRFHMDPSVCLALYLAVNSPSENVTIEVNHVCTAKAIKNEAELAAFREGHIQDAVALISYLCWLETAAINGTLMAENEYSVGLRLAEFRRAQPDNLGLSFDSISSIDENNAIIHYKPPKVGSKQMSLGCYLIDSGGQYRGCTTDVTRTVHLGNPTDLQRECFTRVLKGHIALAKAIFPKGTKGPQLDVLARQFLWQAGLNFLHGTGHGVGAYLSVHEGPCGISNNLKGPSSTTDLSEGMVLSNEPGFYLDGHFGIRHENLVAVKRVLPTVTHGDPKTTANIPATEYYGFENLTLVPFQKKFMMLSLLSPEEIGYVNEYHKTIMSQVGKRIGDAAVLDWLTCATSPICTAN